MNEKTQQTEQVQGQADDQAGKDDIDPNALQSVISEAGEDDEENQSDFDAEFGGGDQVVKDLNTGDAATGKEEKPATTGDEKAGEVEVETGAESVKEKETAKAPDPKPTEMDILKSHIRKLEGKFGNVNQQLELIKKAGQQVDDKGGDSPSMAKIRAAMKAGKDSNEMSALRENYADWADAIDEQGIAIGAHVLEQIPNRADIVQEARQLAVLDLKHEGWEDTINTAEFAGWLKDQTPENRALIDSSSGKDAVTLLDLYVESNKPAPTPTPNEGEDLRQVEKKKKSTRLESAVQPTGGKTNRPTSDTEQQEFDKAFSS